MVLLVLILFFIFVTILIQHFYKYIRIYFLNFIFKIIINK